MTQRQQYPSALQAQIAKHLANCQPPSTSGIGGGPQSAAEQAALPGGVSEWTLDAELQGALGTTAAKMPTVG